MLHKTKVYTRFLIFTLIVLSYFCLTSCSKPESWILGRWNFRVMYMSDGTMNRTGIGAGSWYVFREDKTATFQDADNNITHGTWEKQGSTFYFIYPDGDKTKIRPSEDNRLKVISEVMGEEVAELVFERESISNNNEKGREAIPEKYDELVDFVNSYVKTTEEFRQKAINATNSKEVLKVIEEYTTLQQESEHAFAKLAEKYPTLTSNDLPKEVQDFLDDSEERIKIHIEAAIEGIKRFSDNPQVMKAVEAIDR